ncbi:bifunctional DNA primase/polymerase [Methylobacterium sp. NMS14P]|uniref:bifunctional DNA primase/polymerase n=1 Tax=Methylobacterium sp. NMS14P TaxID=2894310 RepID=UPI002359991B|nr:bifunctional DNA primase/polymerase [Methylobacterium sp. NMS14P]WCS23894.1 bifunctional DNA primase/polymerase [Methylobacterium sp. NMS14P]
MNRPLRNRNIAPESDFRALAPMYWERGFRVLPLEPSTKRPAQELKGWPGFASSPLSGDRRAELINRYSDRGLGILTGTELSDGYRLGAIDVDQDAFVPVVQAILGDASCAKKGKKGLTVFVRYSEDLKSTKVMDGSGGGAIDILLGGKFSVLPPSIHPETGRPYIWVGSSLLDADLGAMPIIDRETLTLLRAVVGSPHAQVITTGAGTHDAGVAFAAQLVAHGCNDEQIVALVTALLPAGYDGNSLAELPGWVESARQKGYADTTRKPGGGRSETVTATEMLVGRLAEWGVELFHDERKRGFISIPTETGGVLTYAISSSSAAAVLQQAYYTQTGRALKEAARTEVIALLEARAKFDGPCEPVFTRIGRLGPDVVIDLGRTDGHVVHITAAGYQVLHKSPVRFIRTAGMLELPEPVSGGSLRELQQLLALPDETYTLVLAFLINALRPGGPYLCMLIEGEQGSGKSFLSSALRRLIDPNQAEKVRLPENERDLMVMADALFLLVFDNSSGMGANVSDALCSLATGGGYVSRKLYTDGELYTMNATRPFIINGISDVATKSDLIERVIPVELTRMDDDARRTEAEMNAEIEALRPRILGALYMAIARAVKDEHQTELSSNIRMADAARWLAAAEPATGLAKGSIIDALMRCQTERIIERTNNDVVGVELRNIVQEKPFEGTISDLLFRIKPERPSRYFPDTALKLSKHLDGLKTGLKLVGIHFDEVSAARRGS